MEWVLPQDKIKKELLYLEQASGNKLINFDRAISYCQKMLEQYRMEVASQGFVDEAEEIRFFKREKPFLFGLLQKYTHQLTFQLDYSTSGKSQERIEQKMVEINSILSLHKDLILYLELGHEHMDPQYFLRKNRYNNTIHTGMEFSFDPRFSTSHDSLVAHIFGYQGFYTYLEKQLEAILPSGHDIATFPKIAWTSSKTALTELGFALYYSGAIGHGNTGLSTIMQFLEQASGLDLGDYHHTSIRLRNRSNPTKFLDRLHDSLKKWMEDLDN